MSDIIDIGILGADGRMGRAVIQAISHHPQARVGAAFTAPSSQDLGIDSGLLAGVSPNSVALSSDIPAGLDLCDVVIDFSTPRAAIDTALAMHGHRATTLVSGTTGFTPAEDEALLGAAHALTLLRAGNFSPGVTALAALVERAAKALDTGWDIEILDMHHRAKVDAPSGTAILLGEAAAKGRDTDLSSARIPAREGVTGPRRAGGIGFAALRGGGVIGAHEVRIANDLEMLTLSHDAFDRSVFAKGAVSAAIWAHAQPKGQYSMRDVLGF